MIPLKNEIYHACTLEVIPDVIPSKLHPNAGGFEKCFNKCRAWLIISPKNYRSKEYFRSRYAIKQERQRHLSTPSYRYVVHPFSKFAQFREVVMAVVWSVMLFVDPFMGTFVLSKHLGKNDHGLEYIQYIQSALGLMAGLDIFTNFFLGFTKKQTREVILEPKKIIRRYLLTYFIFDLAALIDSMLAILLQYLDLPISTEVLMEQQYLFRLARLGSATTGFGYTLKLFNLSDSAVQCISIVVSTVFILHWWTCILGFIPILYQSYGWDLSDSWTIQARVTLADNRSVGETYIRFLLVVMCHFYGASRTSFWSENAAELAILSLIIVCGIGYYTYAIAVVGQLFRSAHISETKYNELITQVKQYAHNKQLSAPVTNRLLHYYESKFQRRFFQEHAILKSLSEHLRLEVTLYSCKHLIESVHVFQGLSKSAIGTLLSLLKQEIFLPGDQITSSSRNRNDMYYFVSYGTVACIVVQNEKEGDKKNKIEVMHLEDGDHFGESEPIAKLDAATEVYYTVAIEQTEIYNLTRRKLLKCEEMFPMFAWKIVINYRRRRDYMAKFLEMKKDKTHEDNILGELANGRILSHGRKRNF